LILKLFYEEIEKSIKNMEWSFKNG
jgi:hypothetical protein